MSYKTPEKKIQDPITDYLDYLIKVEHQHIYYDRRSATGIAYKKGLPDIYVIVNGVHIEVEIKAPGGQRRADQERWERRFKAMGVPYLVTDSVELFKSTIQTYLKSTITFQD